jgi:hypothetical protein
MDLVIPSHRPHYDFNVNFLNSFDKFCLDKANVKINIIVNKEDNHYFNNILKLFPSLNIKIITLTDLIFNVDGVVIGNDVDIFNSKYPLQSLKKLFSYTITNGDYIVIDSENLCLKNFYFKDIIENEKNKPIFYCENTFQELQKKVLNSCNSILNQDENKWFFLKSYWFYEKKIVEDLVCELKKTYSNITLRLNHEPFFEYQLYCQYILKNNLKEIINLDLYNEDFIYFSKILTEKNNNFEYICVELNEENISKYLGMIEKMNDRIIRLHWIPDDIKNKIIDSSNIAIGTFHWG